MRRLWAGGLVGLVLACWAPAQELRWQPVSQEPLVTLGAPTVSLLAPVPATKVRAASQDSTDFRNSFFSTPSVVAPATDSALIVSPIQAPTARGDNARQAPPVSLSARSAPASPPPPPAAKGNYDPLPSSKRSSSSFGDVFAGWTGGGANHWQSDHEFDSFISPVTNPFLFEDPRALTEARPIFLYQAMPNSNWVYGSGSAVFYGTQLRLAFNEQWSAVINKLGGVTFNSGDNSLVPSQSSFAELWLGPKWTFYRNCQTDTVVATGLTFQLPTGNGAGQGTPGMSLVPYLSVAQGLKDTRFGSFNIMDTLGYSLRTNSARSEYFYNSFHIDYDVGNSHKLYPFVELNWLYYARSGNRVPWDFEGGDLANFGSMFVSGHNNLDFALGARYKFTECVQTGLGISFPIVGTKDINAFRVTLDLIFRY